MRNIQNINVKIDSEKIIEIYLEIEDFLKPNHKFIDINNYYKKSLFHKTSYIDSLIIIDKSTQLNLKNIMPAHNKANLIYRGTRDGFKTINFYDKALNISPSFVLIKSKEHQ